MYHNMPWLKERAVLAPLNDTVEEINCDLLSLFLKISAVTYTTACARAYGFVFERHQRSDFLVEKLYGMRARALAVHVLARAARAGPPATAWLLSEYSEAAPQSGQMSCGR